MTPLIDLVNASDEEIAAALRACQNSPVKFRYEWHTEIDERTRKFEIVWADLQLPLNHPERLEEVIAVMVSHVASKKQRTLRQLSNESKGVQPV